MHEKPTTSNEVLREELRDDMLDVAHVDPVGDTGDRLVQSIPRKTSVFRAIAILCCGGLEGVQPHRGHVHTAGV